jgi:hypothetical protein
MEPTAPRLTELPGLTPSPRPSGRTTGVPRTVRDEPTVWDDGEIALRLLPGGNIETIPLTMDILLNPSEDIHVPQNDAHSDDIYVLMQRLKRHAERRPGRRLFTDLSITWPGESRDVSPDIAIVDKLKDSAGRKRTSLNVADEGCRVRTVIEVVTTTSRIQREKDEDRNPPLFARNGVSDCVLIYPAEHRKADDVPLVVHTLIGGQTYGYKKPDSQGRFLLRALGVYLSVCMEGGVEKILAEDAKTGELLTTVDEEEARRKAEEAKRKAETSKRRKAERQTRKEAEARRQAEDARQQAEDQVGAASRAMAECLLFTLENRGLSLSADERRCILDCRDPRKLQQWTQQAFIVATVRDLLT